MSNRPIRIAVVVSLWALAASGAAAADLEAGKTKAAQVCAACHGADGNTPIDPSYPRLAGQHRDFMAQALRDYKQGRRENVIMSAQAKQLSSKDIDNLAAWYASLPGPLYVRK